MNKTKKVDLSGPESPHFNADQQATDYKPWEEVDSGRFMPRRTRGSCQGRALG